MIVFINRRFLIATLILLVSACSSMKQKDSEVFDRSLVDTENDFLATLGDDPYFQQLYPEVSAAFNDLYKQALSSFEENKLSIAKQEFMELIAMNDQVSAPYFQLALIHKALDNTDLAIDFAKKAVIKNTYNYDAHNLLGILYRQQGLFSESEAQYQQLLELWQGYASAHLNLGILYDLYLNNMSGAIAAYKKYLRIAKEDRKVSAWIADLSRRLARENNANGQ